MKKKNWFGIWFILLLPMVIPSNLIAANRLSAYQNLDGLNPEVLALGLKAYQCGVVHRLVKVPLLTIVDYTLPSSQKRLWVIDPQKHKILYRLLVAQGVNSGTFYARYFSNKVGSLESSLGVFITGASYYGKHGYSMRLYGLEKGINNNAYERDIVMHSAWYVNDSFVKKYGRLGRSWGCLAINPAVVHQVIDLLKGGSMIFSYAPSERQDKYIRKCEF